MIGERKRWFKILTWSKYQELKDKPLEYENELVNLRTKIKTQDNNISRLKAEKLAIEQERDAKIQECNEAIADKVKAENERDKAFDDTARLKKSHAEEKSNLRSEIKELKAKLKKLEDEGVVLPTRVKGSTMPKKKQAVKETVRPIKK